MCKVHIALQEIQAAELMQCKMTCRSSGKVISLQLDNGTTETYLCNQCGTLSTFSFQTSLLHFQPGQPALYKSYSSTSTYPSQCQR